MQEPTGAALSAQHTPDDDGTPAASSRSGVLRRYVLAAIITLVLDQASKVWALGALGDGRVRPLIGDLLSLRLIHNSGAAFSIGDSMTWLMSLIAVMVTLAILWASRRVGSRRWALALGLLLGGSLGNLVDRFFRDPGPLRGHVVDFIDYGGLFVGNIADIAIVAGAGLLIWLVFTNVGLDGSRPQHATGGATDE
ncbi:signal peptidase II [Janibacter sp. Soil728]|uniref:signal peptidase II n=1 Tax=Janibacter sp. Soil728 TaxID=1736393 RepID=UPI0006FA0FD6|nr:signal peptidase II [Janibacter sp. Soil728]KRE38329.1 signal peptidase II [Janibacter sp. Soil728]